MRSNGSSYPDDGLGGVGGDIGGQVFPPEGAVGVGGKDGGDPVKHGGVKVVDRQVGAMSGDGGVSGGIEAGAFPKNMGDGGTKGATVFACVRAVPKGTENAFIPRGSLLDHPKDA